MKIIDFYKKGNLVRFYLGKDDLETWWGDDWDDKPYEHNAEQVYEEFISGYVDVYFPFEFTVLEPCEDYHYDYNSPYSKDDFINRKVPCIVGLDNPEYNDDCFSKVVANNNSVKFYFGDKVDDNYNKKVVEYSLLKVKE